MLKVFGLTPLVAAAALPACKARRTGNSGLRNELQNGQNAGGPQNQGLLPIDANLDWGMQPPAGADGQQPPIQPIRALEYCFDPSIAGNGILIAAVNTAVQKINASGVIWSFAPVAPCNANVHLTIGAAMLGPLARVPNVGEPVPVDAEDPYRSSGSFPGGNPGARPPGGNPNAVPPGVLAFFRRGPAIMPGQKYIATGEIIFNIDPTITWNSAIGSKAFDPVEVALHEFGHAMRLDHDSTVFNDDVTKNVTGSMPGGAGAGAAGGVANAAPAGAVAVEPGQDGQLQTLRQGNDVLNRGTGNIETGNDGIVHSGKTANIMEPFAVFGRHGVNPNGNIQNNPMARYNYSPMEIPSLISSAQN